MKKLTKKALIAEIDQIIHKDYLKEISELAINSWKTYMWISTIGSYRVKYYSKMKPIEIFYMLVELKKCLNIELTERDNFYINENEKIKVA